LDANGKVPPSTLSVAGASAAEGQPGTTLVPVRIALSGPATAVVRVNWATANGSATAGNDYVAASGTVTFELGQSVKTVQLAILDDTVVEPNETFTVRLSGAVGAAIATSAATVTITSDDVQALAVSAPAAQLAESAPAALLAESAPAALLAESAPAPAPPATAWTASRSPLAQTARPASMHVSTRTRASCSRGRRLQSLACGARWIVVRSAARLLSY
ncbi:MAG TPA: Calx-beta domain-containing protein, partial [Solirubrobacteraceae bacterium]|nr:Calx-beta domain-containing protein [Solirubrobacteraceae bacterium]